MDRYENVGQQETRGITETIQSGRARLNKQIGMFEEAMLIRSTKIIYGAVRQDTRLRIKSIEARMK